MVEQLIRNQQVGGSNPLPGSNFHMPHRTLSSEQVAGYLHLESSEIERMAKRGEIPHHRNGPLLVFRKNEVDAWASQRLLALHPEHLIEYHNAASHKQHDMSARHALIPELMKPEWIVPEFHARTKPSVIREMCALADATKLVVDAADLQASLIEREKMASTALGGGVALLHPPYHQPYQFDDSFIVLARTLSAIPFGSPDGQATDLFFLICTQDDWMHLHILSRICMMCHTTSLLMELRDAADRDAMYAALVRAEDEVIQFRLKAAGKK